MQTASSTLLAQAYIPSQQSPFQDCPVDTVFEHGIAKQVAVFEPTTPGGYRCKVTETRLPAVCYTAVATAPDGRVKTLSTGSGNDIGRLLRRLCEEFQSGAVSFDCDESIRGEKPLAKPRLEEDGRRVEVFQSGCRLGRDGFDILIDESCGFRDIKAAQSLFVRNWELARATAKAIAQGMLDISPGHSGN